MEIITSGDRQRGRGQLRAVLEKKTGTKRYLRVVSAGRVDGLSHDVQVVFRQHGRGVVDALTRTVESCRSAKKTRILLLETP